MCQSSDVLQRYGQIRQASVASIHAAGFALLPTGRAPHFDIVLPDLSEQTLTRLDRCFANPMPNPSRQP
jgi:hypothetical protein